MSRSRCMPSTLSVHACNITLLLTGHVNWKSSSTTKASRRRIEDELKAKVKTRRSARMPYGEMGSMYDSVTVIMGDGACRIGMEKWENGEP